MYILTYMHFAKTLYRDIVIKTSNSTIYHLSLKLNPTVNNLAPTEGEYIYRKMGRIYSVGEILVIFFILKFSDFRNRK